MKKLGNRKRQLAMQDMSPSTIDVLNQTEDIYSECSNSYSDSELTNIAVVSSPVRGNKFWRMKRRTQLIGHDSKEAGGLSINSMDTPLSSDEGLERMENPSSAELSPSPSSEAEVDDLGSLETGSFVVLKNIQASLRSALNQIQSQTTRVLQGSSRPLWLQCSYVGVQLFNCFKCCTLFWRCVFNVKGGNWLNWVSCWFFCYLLSCMYIALADTFSYIFIIRSHYVVDVEIAESSASFQPGEDSQSKV